MLSTLEAWLLAIAGVLLTWWQIKQLPSEEEIQKEWEDWQIEKAKIRAELRQQQCELQRLKESEDP